MKTFHRIITDINIEEIKRETEAVVNLFFHRLTNKNKRGISFFYFDDCLQISDEMSIFHNTFAAFKKSKCKLTFDRLINEMDGLDCVQDRDITRRKGKQNFPARHVTLYPTIRMTFQEFRSKSTRRY
jgi:hypothetical protein